MSESQTKPVSEPKREPREPRALSNEYHKARKQLMLWAGILFIWELVGIDLEKAKDAGTAGAIIGAIKSPQAIPWALLILVLYLLFKVIVEWSQCTPERRAIRAARIDYSSAWVVSLAAIVLYLGQTIARVQVYELLRSSHNARSFLAGTLGAFALVESRALLRRGRENKSRFFKVFAWLLILTTTLFLGVNTVQEVLSKRILTFVYLMTGALVGGIVASILFAAINRRPSTRAISESAPVNR